MEIEITESEVRRTGISVIGDVRWGTHLCYFYETRQDLLDTLVPYFKAGLEQNEFCLWVVPQSFTVEEARRALAQAVPDLDHYLAKGSFEIHSHDEWYLCNGTYEPNRVLQNWREKLNEAQARGYSGMRASGDTAWVQKDQWQAFREYENKLDGLISNQRMFVLCTYPLATTPVGQLFDVARLHHMAVARRHGTWEIVETAELKQSNAEIKRLNEELEKKVEQRTRDLAAANEALKKQIIERKEAERQSRLMIDAIPHLIWSGPPDGTLDYCNDRWRSYMGLELEDLRGDGWQTMLHPDDRNRVLAAWREAVVRGTPYEQEERHRGSDGTYRWFLSRGVPLRDAEERIARWYGTNTDIEDRKRVEAALNAQALRYKTLMETSTDSIYVVDQKGDLQEANAAFLRRRGYSPAEAKGLNVTDWDAQWSREQLRERLRDLVGSSAVFETRHRSKDGSVFDVEVCATSVRIGGEQLFFCVTRDITERKQAEERLLRSEEKFKALFGIAPVGISVLDRQHNLVDANPALEKITRLSKDELLNGTYRRCSYLNPDGTPKPAIELPSEQAFAENRPINNVETGIVTENGEIIWTSVSVAPLALPDASAVVITQDITERKRTEEALKASHDQLRALSTRLQSVREEEATRIAREIHDELGQTLTGLKMDLRRAERKIEELESSPVVNSLLDTLVNATELVDGIITTVQRIAAELRPGVLDKLGLGAALQYEARRFQERSEIRCAVRLPETEPTFSSEVSTALFRIFQECLTNVARHAHAGKVDAELRLESGSVILSMHDDGRGVTPSAMSSHTASGLLGMKERAALLGGAVVFHSNSEEGTTVIARLPHMGTPLLSKDTV